MCSARVAVFLPGEIKNQTNQPMKPKSSNTNCPGLFAGFAILLLGLAAILAAPQHASAAFGLTTSTDFYTVDTGAGLVFKVRRTDNGVSTQSAGDIASLVYNGVEYQNQTRGSQLNSGFDYLYTGVSAVTVSAAVVNTSYIRITVQAGSLTHYYLARSGYPHIYMGTYFTAEPSTLGLCRYIVRIPASLLPNGPVPSDIRNTVSTVESSDIFALSNGQTRSKHYSNMRLKDWSYIGATGSSVGIWMVRDNNEGNSGGPFYRCLLNQCGTDQEITYIVNYGEAQTEAYRTSILNAYTLVFTTGATPGTVDTSWFSSMGLTGYVAASGRGKVAGVGIAGRDTAYTYTVGFSNTRAQYWVTAAAANGAFSCANMLPGTYTMKIYKNELAVYTGSVTVTAGGTVALNTITITGDPSSTATIWRIGNWDGTPVEFLNGSRLTTMHPSDVRMSSWGPVTYTVGSSSAGSFPAYQWVGVNNPTTIKFTLTAAQVAAHTVKLGITTAYAGGRPKLTVNSWTSANPAAPSEPSTRTLTIGSYRGNNTTYTFSVPASAFVTGQNTMTLTVISGSSGSGYLSPGCAYDCVELDN
jgi:rhamnogalacturonan endolyase